MYELITELTPAGERSDRAAQRGRQSPCGSSRSGVGRSPDDASLLPTPDPEPARSRTRSSSYSPCVKTRHAADAVERPSSAAAAGDLVEHGKTNTRPPSAASRGSAASWCRQPHYHNFTPITVSNEDMLKSDRTASWARSANSVAPVSRPSSAVAKRPMPRRSFAPTKPGSGRGSPTAR